MALDLQTKLQQTKQKLFGINSSEEEFDMIIQNHQDNINENGGGGGDGGEYGNNDSGSNSAAGEHYFRANKEKLSSFERAFKQQMRDEKAKLRSFEDVDSNEDYYDGEVGGKLPGVGNLVDFSRSRLELTPDFAARRIQTAFRLYMARRNKKRLLDLNYQDMPISRHRSTSSNVMKKSNSGGEMMTSTTHHQGSKVANSKFENFLYKSLENKDRDNTSYNFINVYNKKTKQSVVEFREEQPQQAKMLPTSSSSHRHHQRQQVMVDVATSKMTTLNYTEDFVTEQQKTTLTIKSQLTTSGSSSSSTFSSDSTSLSKYISHPANQQPANQQPAAAAALKSNNKYSSSHKSLSSYDQQQQQNGGANTDGDASIQETSNTSNTSNNSSSSTSSSNTSGSSSTNFNATTVNNQSTNRSNTTGHNKSNPIVENASHQQQQQQHKPLRSTKIIHDMDSKANGGQPRRYSPTSLENLFNVNINYLDTLSMSALQLEELDKIRAIGHAQQETVTLAHLLKEKSNAMLKLKNDEKVAAAAALAAATNNKASKQRSQSAYSNLTATSGTTSRSSSLSSSSSTNSSDSTLNEKEHASENEATDTIKTDSHVKDAKRKHERTSGALVATGGHRSKSYDSHASIQTASEINTDRRNRKLHVFVFVH